MIIIFCLWGIAAQSQTPCDFEIEIRLLQGGKEVDGFDLSDQPNGEYDPIPDAIDANLTVYYLGVRDGRKLTEDIKIDVHLLMSFSESSNCLYALNPVMSQKKAIFSKSVLRGQFPTSGSNEGSIEYRLPSIGLKREREQMISKSGKKLFINSIILETIVTGLKSKRTCVIIYSRQLCAEKPTSKSTSG